MDDNLAFVDYPHIGDGAYLDTRQPYIVARLKTFDVSEDGSNGKGAAKDVVFATDEENGGKKQRDSSQNKNSKSYLPCYFSFFHVSGIGGQ